MKLRVSKNIEDRVRSKKKYCLGDLCVIFLLLKEETRFKIYLIKSNHRVLRKNKVDIYGASIFVPDNCATVLAAKMFTNSHEHSLYIITFLRTQHTGLSITLVCVTTLSITTRKCSTQHNIMQKVVMLKR